MKKAVTKRNVAGWCVCALLTVAIVLGMLMPCVGLRVHADEEMAPARTAADIFTYSSDDFVATEDYSAYVPAARRVGIENVSNNHITSGETLLYHPDGEQKMQLDSGKAGLLLTTAKTGTDAIGAKFGIKNVQYGDFDMDFRIFSERTYEGILHPAIANSAPVPEKSGRTGIGAYDTPVAYGSLYDSNFAPFADIRTFGIKFTSVSDTSKSFIVYFEGMSPYAVHRPSARVYVEGESYRNGGRKGYGYIYTDDGDITNGDTLTNGGFFTPLYGTSFMNVATNGPESFANTIRFDLDTMGVYTKTYELRNGNVNAKYNDGNPHATRGTGLVYEETERLIRKLDVADGNNANGALRIWPLDQLHTLTREDFLQGYTVEMFVDDMTANDTALYATTKQVKNGDVDNVKESMLRDKSVYPDAEVYLRKIDADNDGNADTYNRTGKIIIYNVNGLDMRVNEGFTKSAISQKSGYGNALYKGAQMNGYQFTANAKNTAAEGNSFTLNASEFEYATNKFGMFLGAVTKQRPATATANSLNGADSTWDDRSASYYNGGMGTKMNEYDPYSDVRELGVTFRSKSNPTAAFTVYLMSSDISSPNAVVRTGVEGEAYRTLSGLKGFGYTYNYGYSGAQAPKTPYIDGFGSGTKAVGTMGAFDASGNMWTGDGNIYTPITVDFSAMKVYTYVYETELLVRDLTKTDAAEGCKALNAADFANGEYTVTVSVERMNTAENKGLRNFYSFNYNPDASNHTVYVDAGRRTNTTWPGDGKYVLSAGYDRACKIGVFSFKNGVSQATTLTENVASGTEAQPKYTGATHKGLNLGYTGDFKHTAAGFALHPSVHDLFGATGEAVTSIRYAHKTVTDDNGEITVASGAVTFTPKNVGEYTLTANGCSVPISVQRNGTVTSAIKQGYKLIYTAGETATFAASDIAVSGATQSTTTAVAVKKNGTAVSETSFTVAKGDTFEVTYSVSDALGKLCDDIVQTVKCDDEAPTLAWEHKPSFVKLGEQLDMSGITAVDAITSEPTITLAAKFTPESGDEQTLTVTDKKTTAPNANGIITVTATATDGSGNTVTQTYEVEVSPGDIYPPEITYTVPAHILSTAPFDLDDIVIADDSGFDAVYEVKFVSPAGAEQTLTPDGDNKVTLPGKGHLKITVTATDKSEYNNQATETYEMLVLDTEDGYKLNVTLKEGFKTTVSEGDMLSFTAADIDTGVDYDVAVTVQCTLNDKAYDGSEPRAAKTGIYKVTYTVTDMYGGEGSIEATVLCTEKDTVKPAVSWDAPVYVLYGATLDISGITATDDITASPTLTVTAVFTPESGEGQTLDVVDNKIVVPSAKGSITVTATATDENGNEKTENYTVLVYEKAPDTEGDNGNTAPQIPKDSGCGGSVAGASASVAIVLLTLFAAIVASKKRKA